MNIAFFLTPKYAVTWIAQNASVRDAMDRFDESGWAAIPILDADGRYVGTLAEGDLLRMLAREPRLRFADLATAPLADVPLRAKVMPVEIDAQIEELFSRAFEQSFVPVVDARGVFIGLVRRRAILEQFAGMLQPRSIHEPVD